MLGAIMYFLIWGPLNLARRIFWRWTVEGLEHLPPRGTGVVLAANHLNWLDIVLVAVSLPFSHRPAWLAKAELFENPVLAWWFRQMQVIPIRRGKRDMNALHEAENALRKGALLIIFPEGHRSKTGGLIEGRGGAVRLAGSSHSVILPTAVWGSERGLGGLVRRKPVHVRFGPAYTPEGAAGTIPADKMRLLTSDLMLRIADLLPESYHGIYREQYDERKSRMSLGSPE